MIFFFVIIGIKNGDRYNLVPIKKRRRRKKKKKKAL